jgi:hypothetical protein
MNARTFDYDKFRLRNFVDKLIAAGEVEVHDEPVPLSDVAGLLMEDLHLIKILVL